MKAHHLRTAAWIGLFVALCAAVAVAAQSRPATTQIKIDNFSFTPSEVRASVGATVVWTNRDDIPHTVISTDKVFKSKVLDSADSYSFTFTAAGTYPYFCSIHPKMTGKVIVE